jgi:hypothetical protein
MSYYMLCEGELIEPGDEFLDYYRKGWTPTKSAGDKVSHYHVGRYRRLIMDEIVL